MDTLQYVTSASVTGEWFDGDGVGLSMTQQPPPLQPSLHNLVVFTSKLSPIWTGKLWLWRDSQSTRTSTFLPRNKTIVCWWYEIVGYQGVTATTSPSQETMPGQSRDKIVQVASSSSGWAVLGWGRLNKSKVTTGDDYLDKPYLVSV